MYGDDDVQGGATFKRGTGADQALRARTRNHNRLAHIFGCLVQDLHFVVSFPLVTSEAQNRSVLSALQKIVCASLVSIASRISTQLCCSYSPFRRTA